MKEIRKKNENTEKVKVWIENDIQEKKSLNCKQKKKKKKTDW